MNPTNARRHALVIGGSIAGLLAARVLADHFAQVTIVERDQFPARPEPRKGVPQARHVHILLRRGELILERLFPGITAELTSCEVPLVDWTNDVLWLSAYGWMPRFKGMCIPASSRDLLEWHIRRRLAAVPNVRWIERTDVTGLLADQSRTRVTGVRVRNRDRASESNLDADLVVDASGRTSRAPQWLEALGHPAPRETVINSQLGYSSRIYQPPRDFAADWKVLLVRSSPALSTRGGGVYPIEGGRWMVTLAGARRDYPPTDEAGFIEFARSLPSLSLYDAIRDAQPLTDIGGYQRTENRLRHYEAMARRPENFVLLGDAVCGFNPVYGQGMSVAAMGAEMLDACLRVQRPSDLTGLAARFQQRLAKLNQTPWLLATAEDSRVLGADVVPVSPARKLVRRYTDRVSRATTQDVEICRVFMNVAHLLVLPSALFAPRIAVRALTARLDDASHLRSDEQSLRRHQLKEEIV